MATCGTVAGYTAKCRCDLCRAAWSTYQREWRAKNRPKVNAWHRRWMAAHPGYDAEKQRRYREVNKAEVLERKRLAYLADPEKFRRRQRIYAQSNREKVDAQIKRWQVANPERVRHKSREYKRRKRAATYLPITREQIQAKVAFWGDRCWMCGGEWDSLDHVKPLKVGGPHILANLRPACRSCNSAKHIKWPLSLLTKEAV